MMKPTKKKNLTIDVGVIASLGRDSIKDHATAILELIKNSYDSGASIVDIEISNQISEPFIRVADNGCGMTEKAIDNNWLRIGYSEKINERYIKKRRKTGEKGIGRLSADRLGEILDMRSRTPEDGNIRVMINWNDFNKMGENLENIKIDYYDNDVEINLPKHDPSEDGPESGTELIIRILRQEWAKNDFEELYKQLSMLISPFDTKVDFDIRLRTDTEQKYEKVNPSEIGKYFEVMLDATYSPLTDDISYQLKERNPKSHKRIKKPKKSMSLNQLIADTKYDVPLDKTKLGPVRVVLYYYPRNKFTILGSGFRLKELGDYLTRNAGIKLYRDSIRVKPYGEMDSPGGDWLNLGYRFAQNPAGRSRPSHRIRPNQLVGAIFISRDDNPELSDSASREGLIQYDSFRLLYELVLGCIRVVEASSHEIFTKQEALIKTEDDETDKDIGTVNKKLVDVRDDLQDVASTLTKHDDTEIREIGETVTALVSKMNYASASLELLESQTRLYRGLATIGIASAVFGHETQLRIASLVGAVNLAKDFLLQEPPKVSKSLSNMDLAIQSSQKVLAWGGFALDRIRRDKRKRKSETISKIIFPIYKELESAFEAIDIDVDIKDIDQGIKSKLFQIDLESIILNLLTNAYTACRQVKNNRKIKIKLEKKKRGKRNGFSLIVSDSGPGVNKALRSIIWEPAFSTKTTEKGATEEGTGMGLAIIDGIVEEMNGLRKVDDDPELQGARFEIWLPIFR